MRSQATTDPQHPNVATLFTVEQVASLLNCSPRHVYRLSDAGKMPSPMRLGALVRWRKADIDGWIENGCRTVRTVTSKRGA